MATKNEKIQLIFGALYRSMPAILNVMFLGCFFFFLFSVMGMGFFMGQFYSCDNDVSHKDECLGTMDSDGGYAGTYLLLK